MNHVIVHENIQLRPITLEDTDCIVKWRNDPFVRNNFIFRGTFTKEIHEQWMQTKVLTGEVIQYIIEYDQHPVGSVYLRDIDCQNQSGEFGIFIGEALARGKHIGSLATTLFTDALFESENLHRIFLRVLARNTSAKHAYEHAGFSQEGYFKDMVCLDGVFEDVIFMTKFAKGNSHD